MVARRPAHHATTVALTPLPKTAAPALPTARLLVVAGAMFASVSSEFLPTGILPDISADLGVSPSQVGLLVTVFAFTVALTAAPLLRLTMPLSRKHLMIAMLVAFAITNVICALAPNYWVLAGARVFGGLAHGLFWAVAGPYASRLVASAQVVRATAVTNSGGTLAFMLGVPIGTAIGHAFGWRAAFAIMAAAIVVFAVLVAAFLPPVEHRVALRTGEIPIPARRDPTLPLVVLVCVTVLLAFAGQNVLMTFIAPWLLEVPAVGGAAVAPILFVGGVGGALGLVVAGWVGNRDPHRVLTAIVGLLGLVGVGFGIATLAMPGLTELLLLSLIAGWAIARGVMEIVVAIRLRKAIDNEWTMGLSGLLSIGFGALLIARPGAGALAMAMVIGIFMIVIGTAAIALSFRLRGLKTKLAGTH